MEQSKMKTSRKHLLAAAVSLPLALTLLTACGDSTGTITRTGTAGPAEVPTATTTTAATTTTTPAASAPKATATKVTTTKPVTSKAPTNGTGKTKPPTS